MSEKGWRVLENSSPETQIMAGGFGPLNVLQVPGCGEWSCNVVRVKPTEDRAPCIEALGPCGSFRVTGFAAPCCWTTEPEHWPEGWDAAVDGPDAPELWKMEVGGIDFRLDREDAGSVKLGLGRWVTVEVSMLTLWG